MHKSLCANAIVHLLLTHKSQDKPILVCDAAVFSPKWKEEIVRHEPAQNCLTRKLWIRVYGFVYTVVSSAVQRNQNINRLDLPAIEESTT